MTFLDLENPDHAYLFGFLQADGHLYRGRGQKGCLTVELNARDRGLLERFKELCPCPSSITTRTRTTNFSAESHTAIWSVCALEFRRELVELGIPEGRKSTLITPPHVPFSARDYPARNHRRGRFRRHDGTGFSFRLPHDCQRCPCPLLCRFAEQATGTRRTTRRNRRDGIHNVLYMMEPAVELAAVLYQPGDLGLERKSQAAEALQLWSRPGGMRRVHSKRRWTPEQDQILLSAPSVEVAYEQLGRSRQSCEMRTWRLVGPARRRVVFTP